MSCASRPMRQMNARTSANTRAGRRSTHHLNKPRGGTRIVPTPRSVSQLTQPLHENLMYFIAVVLFAFVCPLALLAIEAWGGHQSLWNMVLIGRLWVFWAVGIRLFIAGIRQVVQPGFTAQTIFEAHDPGRLRLPGRLVSGICPSGQSVSSACSEWNGGSRQQSLTVCTMDSRP